MKRAREFKNIKSKIHHLKLKIWFNRQCLQHNVTPNYAKIRNNQPNSRSGTKAISIAEKTWVQFEIKDLYAQKEILNSKLLTSHLHLANSLKPEDWDVLSNEIHNDVLFITKHKRISLQKKLDNLVGKHQGTPDLAPKHKFNDRVTNLTNTVFTNKEMAQLNLGLKHNYNSTFNNATIKKLITEVESAVQHLPTNEQQIIKHEATDKIQQCVKKQREKQHTQNHNNNNTTSLKKIKEKIKDNNLIISKADKGNTVVIMNKTDYITKTEEFINNNNVTILNKDPTVKYNIQLKQALKDTHFILSNNEKFRLLNMNPRIPTLKSLPKIHKPNTPIRPIVNSRNAPTYHTAKFLHKHLSQHYTFINNRSVKNTKDIIKNLADIHLDANSKLVSFYLESMYSNIPILETIDLIGQNLSDNSTLSQIEIDETIRLLRLTLNQNYFIFNNVVYTQSDGLGMGSPLSGLLADIFVNNLENKLFSDEEIHDKITFWNRFVDDTLVIINSANTTMDDMLNIVNTLHPKLNFTAELEVNNALNFLDLTISRNDNTLKYNIFRKATTTSHTISNTSNHPGMHKRASFQHMIHRALTTPLSTSDYEQEIHTIKNIALENNFNIRLIDTMIQNIKRKLKTKLINTSNTNSENSKFAIFTYINQDIHKVTNILKKHNIRTAFRTDNKLNKHITNNILDKPDPLTMPGVYKLSCQAPDCGCSYVGQSGRCFKVRYREHTRALTGTNHSSFAEHMINNDHSFTTIEQDLTILHTHQKGRTLNSLEQIEIQIDLANSKSNLNEYGIMPKSILHSLLLTPREIVTTSQPVDTPTPDT